VFSQALSKLGAGRLPNPVRDCTAQQDLGWDGSEEQLSEDESRVQAGQQVNGSFHAIRLRLETPYETALLA
jgi:hypothetical protein